MTNAQLVEIAQAHSFDTEVRDGSVYVLIPWSQRLHDGSFAIGFDAERVYDLRSLRTVLGY